MVDSSGLMLPNNSIIDPATITYMNGIRCCGNVVGNWKYPNGSMIGPRGGLLVTVERALGSVPCNQLVIETDSTFSALTVQAEGLYKCNTNDSNGPQELFVGIYTTGSYTNSGE